VKETLAAIQERAKVLGLQADAMHLTRLAGVHARPLSVKRVTMYSAAWVKSQVHAPRGRPASGALYHHFCDLCLPTRSVQTV